LRTRALGGRPIRDKGRSDPGGAARDATQPSPTTGSSGDVHDGRERLEQAHRAHLPPEEVRHFLPTVAATAVGIVGRESELFRKVVFWKVGLLVLLCVLIFLQPTPVLAWMLP
jgi:hypothetical protein